MDVPREDDVVHDRRALGYLEDLDVVHVDEDRDAYALIVTTLKCFLYDLSVMKKRLVVAQGC